LSEPNSRLRPETIAQIIQRSRPNSWAFGIFDLIPGSLVAGYSIDPPRAEQRTWP
jgi:hypothetical protein